MFTDLEWLITGTTSSTRANLFSKRGYESHHIATIISGSSRNLQRFDESLALIKMTPELIKLLIETQKILNNYHFIQSPSLQQLEHKITNTLDSVFESGLIK